MFSCVSNDWFCLYLLALNPLVIINSLEFTSLSNYWLGVVLVPLTIFSMTVFNSKTSSSEFLLFGSANILNWHEKDRICSAIIVFPFRSLKSGLSWMLLYAVPWEDCIISCCRLTNSVCNTAVEVQCSPTTYSGFCCTSPAGQCSLLYLSLVLRLSGVTSKPVLSEVLWVTLSGGFVSFLSFFPCFKFLDVDSVPWNVNAISYTIYVNKASQTAFIWFALSYRVHDIISCILSNEHLS